MPSARLTSKGQITIPKTVRLKLGLRVGEHVSFHEKKNGEFSIHREVIESPFSQWEGKLKHNKEKSSDKTLKKLRGE